ncbi:hypothetical protein [Marinilactibacillus sp. Marseille-P9653]|uniref:hypothetical protein n=1 Tax=Marinilactibacillus sp. Marseille-P9653 TaxID=2866583 RepID=UPI001CE48342|nr:hypothetical protein [Marinilactibacillus sp. Marseille-P9653]
MRNDKEFQEIIAYASTLGMSTDDYLVYLHHKNQAVKSILLDDSTGFKQFLQEFHDLLDGLTVPSGNDDAAVSERKEQSVQASVDLLARLSSDPILLAQMYEHYQYDSDEDSNTIMNKK